ncbi:MAG: response regulator transcription factor [Actinomycetota bacterium]
MLVVEDEGAIRGLLEAVLRSAGHEVDEAASGEQALARLTENDYEVVVLDVMLGQMSGWDVLTEVERLGLRGGTRVLALTARSEEWDFVLGWTHGVDEYLTKPFDPEVVQNAVRQVLEQTPEELAVRRKTELARAQLLLKLETSFQEPEGES